MKRVLLLALASIACGSKERDLAMARLTSTNAKQRTEAVKQLSKVRKSDDEAWTALARAARDGSPAVRAETAAAMAAIKRDDAPDAIAPLLRDPDDSVRLAATSALSTLCGERTNAYLRMAFAHSDAQVRTQLIDALQKCGVDPAQTLRREENERRRKAQELLASQFGAQRARGARELGLLGRDEDKARLLPLLGERDGVVVAAAARALADCGAADAAPKIAPLLDEGGEVAAAAAEALLALGATGPACEKLLKLAVVPGDEAVPAAAALLADPQPPKAELCAAALAAQNPQAAALLSEGCPAAPFAKALAAGGKRDSLVEALLRAEPPAPGLEVPLAKLLKTETDARLPRLAAKYRVAGTAVVEAIRKEQAERSAEHNAHKARQDDDGSAAAIARAPAPAMPSKERFDRLMTLLQEHAGAKAARVSASSRLDALLHGDAAAERRTFLIENLLAARAIDPSGSARLLSTFARDDDPAVAAAAEGKTTPAATPKAVPKPRQEPRVALWSDDAAVRAQACSASDPTLTSTRKLLAASDPERRVRLACAATNETEPRK